MVQGEESELPKYEEESEEKDAAKVSSLQPHAPLLGVSASVGQPPDPPPALPTGVAAEPGPVDRTESVELRTDAPWPFALPILFFL